MVFLVILGLFAVLAGFLIALYNRLVKIDDRRDRASTMGGKVRSVEEKLGRG